MSPIEVGKRAPGFELRDQAGESHALKDYAGRVVVLYFYPKDDTAGCTDQACQFRDQSPDFSKVGAVVLGVSPDDEKSHAKFAAKHGLGFTLLADTERDKNDNLKVCVAYGVWGEKTLYGRNYMGVIRTTYLIDAKGVVRRRWDNVSVPGHVAEVLTAVKELEGGTVKEKPVEKKPVKKDVAAAPGPLLSLAKGTKGVLGGGGGLPQTGGHGKGSGSSGGARRPAGGAKTGVPRRPGGKRGG